MNLSRRIVTTCLCAPTQIATATVLSFALARLLQQGAAGWGDLIGVVLGVVIGPGIGLSIVLTVAGRALGRSPWSLAATALGAAPSAVVVNIGAGVLGLSLPVTTAGYLLASSGLVWWYCGRSASVS